eukprot:3104700-Rhodomonas_salina.2
MLAMFPPGTARAPSQGQHRTSGSGRVADSRVVPAQYSRRIHIFSCSTQLPLVQRRAASVPGSA